MSDLNTHIDYIHKLYKDYVNTRLSFWRIWHYDSLSNSFILPSQTANSGYTTVAMMVQPNETSKVTLVGLDTDNDGVLDNNSGVEFQLQYVMDDNTRHTKTIFQMDLSNPKYKRHSIMDRHGLKHHYIILFNYMLNQIQNYKQIRLMNMAIRQYKGVIHGNECAVVLSYEQINV